MRYSYKRYFIIIATILFLLSIIGWVMRKPIALMLMGNQLAQQLRMMPAFAELPDGLHLVLCGAGSPLPDVKRSGPCVGVVAGEHFFVLDAGTNGARNLARMGWGPGYIHSLLLTHFHSDHIDGLGEMALLRWTQRGATSPLPVYGPEGVSEIVAGFNRAYRLDTKYRIEHHGADTMPPSGAGMVARVFEKPAAGEIRTLLEEDGVKISVFPVDHDPVDPSVGYRFDYKGRSLVVSGDTKKVAMMEEVSRGVDLLAHEALSAELVGIITAAAREVGNKNIVKITMDILDYHATPAEAAEVARDAGVGHLLLYHIVPPLPIAPLEEIFLEEAEAVWDGDITLGEDGVMISLPAGTDDIEVEELF